MSLIRTNTADYVSQALSPAIFQSDQEPEGTNTYVFNTTPFSGICQSCHQNTDYWQNSGALPETLHNYGSQCTSCHTHNSGFQPGGCGDCHQQAPLSELPRFANAMHHIMASTDDANCLACHNVSGHAALDVTLNDPADVPTEIYESCNNCHHDASPLMADGHAGRACTQCHDFDIGTAPIGGAGGSGCGTANSCHGTSKSHPTHMLTASEGGLLGIDCEECHNVLSIPQFADGQDLLSSTTVCDNCHSSAGAYDGTVLAKANFETGVYESGRTALKSGSEYWCASCHDDAPARSRREDHTPLIVDNSDVEASRTGNWVNKTTSPGYIGDDYEQSSGGTGTDLFTWQPALPRTAEYKVYAWWINDNFSTSDASFTINYDGGSENIFKNQTGWTVGRWNLLGAFPFVAGSSGSVLLDAINASSSYRVMADAIKWDDPGVLAPNVLGDNTTYGYYVTGHKFDCLTCHDANKNHIDHDSRSYDADLPIWGAGDQAYIEAYRLRDVNGQPAMVMPRDGWGDHDPKIDEFPLCIQCHDAAKLIGADLADEDGTNFRTDSTPDHNLHYYHVGRGMADTDWDIIERGVDATDSEPACISCHNVHGAPNSVMIRHGELISTSGTTDRVPGFNFAYILAGDGLGKARFIPTLPLAGDYEITIDWNGGDNRDIAATNAQFTVSYDDGASSATVTIDQRVSGWASASLGTFAFQGTANEYVELSNTNANGMIIAGSVSFERVGTGELVTVSHGDAAYSPNSGDWLSYGTTYRYYPAQTDPMADAADSVGGMIDPDTENTPEMCIACHLLKTGWQRTPASIP